MSSTNNDKKGNMYSSQLLKGTFDIIILRLLTSHKKMYGYEISMKVKELSEGTISLPEGSLYPILHKMEEKGLVTTEKVMIGKRTRRYYMITKKGSQNSEAKVNEFEKFMETMSVLLALKPSV